MNTYLRRFKMLALQIIYGSGDVLKDDVNDATSYLLRILMTFACVWVCMTEISIV